MTAVDCRMAEGTPSATSSNVTPPRRDGHDNRSSHNEHDSENLLRRAQTGWRIGYARVSTAGQNTARQEDALDGVDAMHTDHASGATRHGRPGLEAVLKSLRPGDTVIVRSLDRLARSVRDALDIVDEIKRCKAHLQILDLAVDTSSPMGTFMLQLFAAVAELERSQIRIRQTEGIAAARSRGTHLGRPSSLSLEQVSAVCKLRESGASYRTLASTFGVSSRTIERALKQPRLTA